MTHHPDIAQALTRLRAAADRVRIGFPCTRWMRISGPGPGSVDLNGQGVFQGLQLQAGNPLHLRCELDLPAKAAGVTMEGDPLEGTLAGLYPVEIRWNGRPVFADEGVPVASGPALFQILPRLEAGHNGTLDLLVRVPSHQTTNWLTLWLTTPGLRARFERLDVAWAQLALAAQLASGPEEERMVVEAASRVPHELIDVPDEALDSAFADMTAALMPMAGKAAALRVHLIGHSHIDMNWLWTWSDTVEVIKRDFKSVLSLMKEFPELTFSHSQPPTYEVIRQEAPELFAQVREHIASGRWETTTLAWIEGDTNMASGEAHARQLLEAMRYSRDVLGAQPTTHHAPDTFGHAGNLPQLIASAGGQRYYHCRANPGGSDSWPAYWWEGDDGTRVLALTTPSYAGEIRASDLVMAAIRAHKAGHPVGLHVHGIGDHGGGPARQNLQALRRFQTLPLLPQAFCSRLDAYTQEILQAGCELPISKGESGTIFEGCYTSHADIKRHNREAENLLCTADTLVALAGQNHNALLQPAWRTVLFNQFHDILDGAGIRPTYGKAAEDFAGVVAAANKAIDASLSALEHGLAPGVIAVTNPLGFEREDWVVVAGKAVQGPVWLVGDNGHRTPGQSTDKGLGFVARIGAFSTVGYRIESVATGFLPPDLSAVAVFSPHDSRQDFIIGKAAAEEPYLKIETEDFRIHLRRDSGILVSFVDKRVDRELVAFGMRRRSDLLDAARPDLALNVLQLIEEHPHAMTAWHYDEVHTDFSLLRGATTQVVESGPARLVVEVRHALRASTIRQRIHFYRDLPRVDFETYVDWQEKGGAETGVPNLKVAFTARMDENEAWYETPFAAVRRPSDGQEVPALRWADVGGPTYGFTILNDSKYGYDALGCRLRLTLLRGTYDPDPLPNAGPQTIRYSFVPHPRDWREAGIVRQGLAFNQPLLVREVRTGANAPTNRHEFAPRLVGAPSVIISCLKASYGGDGRIIRLYESAGGTAEVRLEGLPGGARVWETSVVEDAIREIPVHYGSVGLSFRPWQTMTLRVR